MKTLKQTLNESFNINESQTIADYKATDNESMIIVDGEKYYIKKQDKDSTHFDMHSAWGKKGNDKVWSSKGLTQAIHVGQRRDEPYIKDIASWLKGGLSSEELFNKEYTGARLL